MPRLIRADNYVVIQGWMITELDLKGNELLIYACIYGFTQKENQSFHGSLQYLSDWTNLSKRNVIERIKALIDKGLIVKNERTINGVKACEYRALCTPENAGGSDETSPPVMNHQEGCRIITGGDESSPNNIDNIYNTLDNIGNIENIRDNIRVRDSKRKSKRKKENTEIEIYTSVIDYLNAQTGKKFRATTPSTRTLISARLAEGHKLEDFKRVIDNKTREWKADAKMAKFLRPETLFAPSHFESYLNESPVQEQSKHGFAERAVTEEDFSGFYVDVMNRPRGGKSK